MKRRAEKKLSEIEKRIEALESVKKTLVKLVNACEARRPTDDCPIIEALNQQSSKG